MHRSRCSGIFQNFPARFARLLSYLTIMKVHVRSAIIVRQCCRLPWKFQGCVLFIYFIHLFRTTKTPDIYPVHSNFSDSVKVLMCVQGIIKTVDFLHFFKIECIIIPFIFNFSFKERNILAPKVQKHKFCFAQSLMIRGLYRLIEYVVIKNNGITWKSEGGSLSIV